MRSLRRTACALLALGLVGTLASAQTRSAFDTIVDFSVTLKTVSAAATGETVLPANRLFLLEGSIGEVVVLDDRPQSWKVRVELVAGEWIGTDEVRGYRCWVTFAGAAYAKVFLPEDPEEAAIAEANRQAKAAGKELAQDLGPGHKLEYWEGTPAGVFPLPAYLPQHSRVLVLARAPAPVATPSGEKVMVLEGIAIRSGL